MATLQESFRNLSDQFSAFWSQLTLIKKSILIGTAILSISLIGALITLSTTTPHEYLFTNLSQEDTNEITQNLRSSGFDDFTVDKNGIKVKKSDILRLRMQVAQAGLPRQGIVGWEKFDEDNFTRTEFEQNIQKLRAIQGELSRTIMSIKGVRSARVHLVTPKSSLFVRDENQRHQSI